MLQRSLMKSRTGSSESSGARAAGGREGMPSIIRSLTRVSSPLAGWPCGMLRFGVSRRQHGGALHAACPEIGERAVGVEQAVEAHVRAHRDPRGERQELARVLARQVG